MANQRLIFLVCLASITLFSFHCSGTPTDQSQPSLINNNGSSNGSTTVPPNPTTQPTNTSTVTDVPTPPTTQPTPTSTNSTVPTKPTPTKPTPGPSPTSPTVPTSTFKPTNSPTTPVPNVTTAVPPSPPKPNPHDRSFDLPSFIGGVILSLGVAAISYVVYKFYKTRTDPNYRSL